LRKENKSYTIGLLEDVGDKIKQNFSISQLKKSGSAMSFVCINSAEDVLEDSYFKWWTSMRATRPTTLFETAQIWLKINGKRLIKNAWIDSAAII